MQTRNILNYQGNTIGQLTLDDDTTEREWSNALAAYAQPPEPILNIVADKIHAYQIAGVALLNSIKAGNTLAGITTAQSAQMFTDYQDVLLMIREGAFPTAIYALQHKSPSGFVTQPMLDSWIAQLQAAL